MAFYNAVLKPPSAKFTNFFHQSCWAKDCRPMLRLQKSYLELFRQENDLNFLYVKRAKILYKTKFDCNTCDLKLVGTDFINHPIVCCKKYKVKQKLYVHTKALKKHIS